MKYFQDTDNLAARRVSKCVRRVSFSKRARRLLKKLGIDGLEMARMSGRGV
jgi:hypothetical protein